MMAKEQFDMVRVEIVLGFPPEAVTAHFSLGTLKQSPNVLDYLKSPGRSMPDYCRETPANADELMPKMKHPADALLMLVAKKWYYFQAFLQAEVHFGGQQKNGRTDAGFSSTRHRGTDGWSPRST
jgi:hypothetical protein